MKKLTLEVQVDKQQLLSVYEQDEKIAYINHNLKVMFCQHVENKRLYQYLIQQLAKEKLKQKKHDYLKKVKDYQNLVFTKLDSCVHVKSADQLLVTLDLETKRIACQVQDLAHQQKKEIVADLLLNYFLVPEAYQQAKDFLAEVYVKTESLDIVKQLEPMVDKSEFHSIFLLALDYQLNQDELNVLMRYAKEHDMQSCFYILDAVILQNQSIKEVQTIIEENKDIIDQMNFIDLIDLEYYEVAKKRRDEMTKQDHIELQKQDIRVEEMNQQVEKISMTEALQNGLDND